MTYIQLSYAFFTNASAKSCRKQNHSNQPRHYLKTLLLTRAVKILVTELFKEFQLSKGTCKKLISIMANFWSGCLDKKSLHWLAWDNMAVPKGQGGMVPGYGGFQYCTAC
jgi:hypothetical protein